jgi:outer membrane protein assembly factor BamB
MERLAGLPRGQRIMIFGFIAIGALALLVGVTLLLIVLTVNNSPRSVAQPIAEGVTVREYAILPADDAYPAPVVVAPDGTAYTASYSSGEVYRIAPDGTVTALPDTRDRFGSVAGLVYNADGSLTVLDRTTGDAETSGGRFYVIAPDGGISDLGSLSAEGGTVALNGLTRDAAGFLYAADLFGYVWRFDSDGQNGARWWQAPQPDGQPASVMTDVAYDSTTDTIYATDSRQNVIYALTPETAAFEELYRFVGTQNAPGLVGVTTAPDGTVYVTALDEKALMVLREGDLAYLAGFFRGPWDAAVMPDGSVLITNIDSRALATPGVSPQLPFALDLVTLP